MKIFKDVFSGDELFSDTYKINLVQDCIFEVVGKYKTHKGDEAVLAGVNASAEEADEGTDEASMSGVDIVLNHQLVKTGFRSKKDFTVYLKDYMKKVVKYLEDNNRSGEVDDFKKSINGVMKDLLGSFKEQQFFTGESMDAKAMIAMCLYKDVNGEEPLVLMFFKHGLKEEKC